MKLLKQQGYTMIEVLVALSVFAIIASISSSILYHVFDLRTRVAEQAKQTDEIQIAMIVLRHDIEQLVPRTIRSADMRLFSIFTGTYQYLEFTRGGLANPNSALKRSSLKRVAYLCKDNTLIRRSWIALDAINRNEYDDKVIMHKLQECAFGYISNYQQVSTDWRAFSIQGHQKTEILPAAIQLTVTPKTMGKIQQIFIIEEGLYSGSAHS